MPGPVTVLFPGQGSQYIGMGSSLLGTPFEEDLDLADKILGYPMKTMMLEGPQEDLDLTENAQPAVLSYSVALFRRLEGLFQERGWGIERVMGHSVGEYTALVAAGTLTFEEALLAVHKRGRYMQEAVPVGLGAMYALLKVPDKVVEGVCREVSVPGNEVVPANYNCPGQIVISGTAQACQQLLDWLGKHYKRPWKHIKLSVSAPFHSPLMEPAACKLKSHLDTLSFRPNRMAYWANVDAREYPPGTRGELMRDNLHRQVCGSVLWTKSMEGLPETSLCVECGPGRVLTGLGRKINSHLKIISLDREGGFGEIERLMV